MCTCRTPDCELTSNLPLLRQWPRLLCQLLEESPRVVRLWTDPHISVEKMIHANSTLSMKQVPTPCFDSTNFGRCLRVANCSDFDGAELVGFDGHNGFRRSRHSWTVPYHTYHVLLHVLLQAVLHHPCARCTICDARSAPLSTRERYSF